MQLLTPMHTRAVTIYRSIDNIASIWRFRYRDISCRCDIGDISSATPVTFDRVSGESFFFFFFNVLALFVVFGVMSEFTGRSWKAVTVASVAEIGEEFERAQATEGCKICNMVALRLARGRSKVGEQQGSWMLALWSRCEAQWQHY